MNGAKGDVVRGLGQCLLRTCFPSTPPLSSAIQKIISSSYSLMFSKFCWILNSSYILYLYFRILQRLSDKLVEWILFKQGVMFQMDVMGLTHAA